MPRPRRRQRTSPPWLDGLSNLVAKNPIVILRFSSEEWESLRSSRHGLNEFTIARSYSLLRDVCVPTVGLLVGGGFDGRAEIYFGLLKSRSNTTTLESRLKLSSAHQISPPSEAALLRLLTDEPLKAILRERLKSRHTLVRLSPAVSVHLVETLAAQPKNRQALQAVLAALDAPRTYSGNDGLQEDAIDLALKAFGLSPGETASRVEVVGAKETGLARINIREDAVIEHDARIVPGLSLSDSDLTGRAIFRNRDEVLEVITANKRPLEEVLGVDLIYLNAIKNSIVMVQYKMLEPDRDRGETDWIYRPNGQLEKEIASMRRFAKVSAAGPFEYRLNPQVFYLRFVRRDAALGKNAITMPLDHFEILSKDPKCKGPRGAFRVSYDSLDGRYLRQDGFLDLVRSGYIGAYAKGTADLEAVIRAILKDDRAVVAAVHSSLQTIAARARP